MGKALAVGIQILTVVTGGLGLGSYRMGQVPEKRGKVRKQAPWARLCRGTSVLGSVE